MSILFFNRVAQNVPHFLFHAAPVLRSMEEEVRHILRDAVKEQNRHIAKLGSRIAARFAKAGLSTDLPELHGQIPRSAEFGK